MEENLFSSQGPQNASEAHDRIYALGHSKRELDRLSLQAVMFEPFTRQLFREAGLAPGMRVLDVGSGSGDVAFLAAEAVGPQGEVVGADIAEPAVATATARAATRGLANVRFLQGDPAEMTFERPFDAVVGRLVLLYYPDPVQALRKLARHVRPGGVIAFQDFDFAGARSLPAAPTFDKCMRWMIAAFQAAGTDTQMGLKLYPAFVAAGLPAPAVRLDAAVGGGRDHISYRVVAEVIRSLLPLMEKVGLATADEVDVETLADRIGDEVAAGGGVIVSPSLVGAWARRA